MNQSTDKRAENRAVLLQRGSELAEFEDLLSEFGICIETVRSGLPSLDDLEGARLVVGVGTRLLEHGTPNLGLWPRTIAIVDDASRTLVSQLNRIGVSMIIRRPIHPRALRLLLLHEIYRGPEKRGRKRTLIGHPIRVGAGLFKSKATLLEISPTGARIEMAKTPKVGSKLAIVFGKELTQAKPIKIHATVVRSIRSTTGRDRNACDIGVSFARTNDGVLAIKAILDRFASGPASWKDVRPAPAAPRERIPSAPLTPTPADPLRSLPPDRAASENNRLDGGATDSGKDSELDPGIDILPTGRTMSESLGDDALARADANREPNASGDRRDTTRVPYGRRVVALGEEAARVLVGRDLSPGGMRIDATSSIALGDLLRVALHSGNRSEPVIVLAHALRDDGEDGLVLVFTDLSPRQKEQLDQIIDCSGPIHVNPETSEGDDPESFVGGAVVVAEMLDTIAQNVRDPGTRSASGVDDSFVDASESVEDAR